jgi:hypothetical protein
VDTDVLGKLNILEKIYRRQVMMIILKSYCCHDTIGVSVGIGEI